MAQDYKIADIKLADFGRKEIEIAEVEMPGLMSCRTEYGKSKPLQGARITGSLHMTKQTAVLIETLHILGADIRWCSCNIFSTQDQSAAAIVAAKTAAVFAWKAESLMEYWWCTWKSLTWPDGTGPDLIVDDGGDATLMVHKGYEWEETYAKTKQLPEPEKEENEETKCLLTIIKQCLQENPNKWHDAVKKIVGMSEETTTGVHRLYQMASRGKLLISAINVNDSVTKSKFDNIYGCRHSLPDGLLRATDVMIGGKRVCICGYGDVGKGCVEAMAGAGGRVSVTEIDPICALQAVMSGYDVVRLEDVLSTCDIFVSATGNFNIITAEHMSKMKNNAIVGNIGHFDNEIDMDGLIKWPGIKKENIKPQVDKWIFPDGHAVIVLAEGRLLNLGCACGHPSFVMSSSFTNQTIAQIELWKEKESGKYPRGKVVCLPKYLDEKVARLHLDQLGVRLTVLSKKQADYIDVPLEGPYKNDFYRY